MTYFHSAEGGIFAFASVSYITFDISASTLSSVIMLKVSTSP